MRYHAERGSGAVVRTILAGTDTLFGQWLGVLREQLTAIAGIVVLVPTAVAIEPRMAAVLAALALVYVALNALVIRRTRAGQRMVERHHSGVFGRVGDVIGNVTVVQSFGRLAAEMEAMRGVMADLLAAQYPVLTWWGLLTVLTRTAATLAMVVVLAMGALLVQAGEMTVGEIVAFVAFANLMIGKLNLVSRMVASIWRQAPVLGSYFALLDAEPEVGGSFRMMGGHHGSQPTCSS